MRRGVSPKFALQLTSALHLTKRNSISSSSFLMHILKKFITCQVKIQFIHEYKNLNKIKKYTNEEQYTLREDLFY